MKKITFTVVLLLVAGGGFYVIRSMCEGYHATNLNNDLFVISQGIKEDLSNRDAIETQIIAAVEARRFEIDPQDIVIGAQPTDKMTTAQHLASKLAVVTNYETTIRVKVYSRWIPFLRREYEVGAGAIIQKKVEQRINPQLQELLDAP